MRIDHTPPDRMSILILLGLRLPNPSVLDAWIEMEGRRHAWRGEEDDLRDEHAASPERPERHLLGRAAHAMRAVAAIPAHAARWLTGLGAVLRGVGSCKRG